MVNLTKLYAAGGNPNVIGRGNELDLVVMTLIRREKPNPLLVSEPGVGKTSMAHLLAWSIANNMVPEYLRGFKVVELNTNALLAGPGYRGVFEEKIQVLINDTIRDGKTILFIDEFHTAENLGAMANGQTPGFGNTLKPYLTRPDFRVMGATTCAEYDKMTDKALLRRFFRINIKEPNDEAMSAIIRSCYTEYGKGLCIKSSAMERTLTLSKSMEGFNPDKSKDLVDFVCAFAKMKGTKDVDSQFVEDFYGNNYVNYHNTAREGDTPAVIIEE